MPLWVTHNASSTRRCSSLPQYLSGHYQTRGIRAQLDVSSEEPHVPKGVLEVPELLIGQSLDGGGINCPIRGGKESVSMCTVTQWLPQMYIDGRPMSPQTWSCVSARVRWRTRPPPSCPPTCEPPQTLSHETPAAEWPVSERRLAERATRGHRELSLTLSSSYLITPHIFYIQKNPTTGPMHKGSACVSF